MYLTINEAITAPLHNWLRQQGYSRCAVIVDENTRAHCYPLVHSALPPDHVLIEVPSGETNKHLGTCQHIWHRLTQGAFDRRSVVINLGGGVIGDMGGFCAATYKRGIDFVQIPTTLLAQVDASVGGKVGIDFEGFKNHLGAFRQPAAVLIATHFLRTLPPREWRSGWAEVLKHALVADADHWEHLRQRVPASADAELVSHSVALKQAIAEADPTEQGVRKILNFGHTVGHAVESYLLHDPVRQLRHGEAIAIGMITEAYLSVQRAGLPESQLDDIVKAVDQHFDFVPLSDEDLDEIVPLALQDKKNQDGQIRCVLLRQIGQAVYDQIVVASDLRAALDFYQQKNTRHRTGV